MSEHDKVRGENQSNDTGKKKGKTEESPARHGRKQEVQDEREITPCGKM